MTTFQDQTYGPSTSTQDKPVWLFAQLVRFIHYRGQPGTTHEQVVVDQKKLEKSLTVESMLNDIPISLSNALIFKGANKQNKQTGNHCIPFTAALYALHRPTCHVLRRAVQRKCTPPVGARFGRDVNALQFKLQETKATVV